MRRQEITPSVQKIVPQGQLVISLSNSRLQERELGILEVRRLVVWKEGESALFHSKLCESSKDESFTFACSLTFLTNDIPALARDTNNNRCSSFCFQPSLSTNTSRSSTQLTLITSWATQLVAETVSLVARCRRALFIRHSLTTTVLALPTRCRSRNKSPV